MYYTCIDKKGAPSSSKVISAPRFIIEYEITPYFIFIRHFYKRLKRISGLTIVMREITIFLQAYQFKKNILVELPTDLL